MVCPSEDGFALPSVLFIVTILSLLAASVITLQYLSRQLVLIDVAKLKTEFAAESGIAKTLAEVQSQQVPSNRFLPRRMEYQFLDGSNATSNLTAWGSLLLISSEGRFHKFSHKKTALVANHPDSPFNNALIFANATHQLVFTGTSSVEGDVLLGRPGPTVGNLRDYTSPVRIPVNGSIRREENPKLPSFQTSSLTSEINHYDSLLRFARSTGSIGGTSTGEIFLNAGVLTSEMISDGTTNVFIRGDAIVDLNVARSTNPLLIVAAGHITVAGSSRLRGLVGILASETITLANHLTADQALFYSQREIEMESNTALSAQLIAPSVFIRSGARLSYPSIVISIESEAHDTLRHRILLENHSQVEGFVGMITRSTDLSSDESDVITLSPQAVLTGVLYSNAKVTLDGSVIGSVLVRDFYFYEAPTTYLGWLRSGRISRASLPNGFLLPPVFSEDLRLDVLDWL